jgi:RNA polymerase sigma factor (sigma-70 family)
VKADHVEKLVRDNLDLARFEARRWRHVQTIETQDLVSEGSLALVKAARNYDPRLGHFRTYARIRVRGAITDAVRTYVRKRTLDDGRYAEIGSIDASTSESENYAEIPDRRPSVEAQVVALDEIRGLAEIPAREREVLVRTVVYGDTLAEVAHDLGVGVNYAHRLAAQGAARLRKRAA